MRAVNPSLPFPPNQTFPSFLPPNPNPNSHIHDSSHSESQHPSLDLPSSFSSLNTLIHLANQTLESLSYLTPSVFANHSRLLHCYFDRRHRVPPHSLFRHSLLCPSASLHPIDPTQLFQSLLYPQTLHSSHQLVNENRFSQVLPDSDADLCFSLTDYTDATSNFFYADCPGVVALSNLDEMSKVFTLPRVLAVHCANFVGNDHLEMNSTLNGIRILPSDLWILRSEVEIWNDYPNKYSFVVLRSILGSEMLLNSHLMTWIIENSPRYGVVIDVALRDHIFLLFRLCFMAIYKEALGFQVALEKGNGMEGGSVNSCFKCPILIQVLMWLASQLSVLYGETNGKFFAVNMLRQCILDAALRLLLPSEQKSTEGLTLGKGCHDLEISCSDIQSVKMNELDQKVVNNGNVTGGETVNCRVILVSQVAAAVAALHERFLLEEKIKALRFAHLQTKYQRVSEYNYISQRACEERKRRCNYRPIIEHDGLPKQQSYNEQDANKTKTREELLAEERDYKRRRMSYRGKKAKRSTLQVTRDIIEEYMEEIMKAGGIGCFVKGPEERGIKSEQPSDHNITRNIVADVHTRGSNDPCGDARHSSGHSKKQSFHDSRYLVSDKPQKGHYEQYGSPEDERKISHKDKYDRDHYHRFSDQSSIPSQSHKWKRYPNDRDDEVPAETRHHETKKLASSSSHGRSSSSSRSGNGSSARKDSHKLRASDSWKRNTADNHSSEHLVSNSFSDSVLTNSPVYQ
ncbi:U11/U12 small nuclear ribonucleoprotein 48 kDa protein isoform X2 [Cucumis melo]|uniref:U11/U12 small nuclear ribonucleoprotein 48 kDa protein isoform X2 n=1 Tax=Cucumis melo TaxID=3656 RepID=A0ABM3KII6_CUCME|nr:U11/U12 small nuclear ribonucleoprotein 48 kDa protein isoform X2 [Cucumis melo]